MNGKDIILKARRIADIVNSKFISDEEALDYLNEAYRVYYDKIIGTAVDWAMKTYEPTHDDIEEHQDGNRRYLFITPPDDMYKLRGLSVRYGGTRRDLRVFPKLEEYTFPECSYRLTAEGKIKVINYSGVNIDSFAIEYYPPPQEIVLEQPPLREKVFESSGEIRYCFDSGKFFVFFDRSDFMNRKWVVVDKESLEIVREYNSEDSGDLIGVSASWIYIYKESDPRNIIVARTSINDPFSEIEVVYTYTSPTNDTFGEDVVAPLTELNDILRLTKLRYNEGENNSLEYTLSLISVKNGFEKEDYSYSSVFDENKFNIISLVNTDGVFLAQKRKENGTSEGIEVSEAFASFDAAVSGESGLIVDDFFQNDCLFFGKIIIELDDPNTIKRRYEKVSFNDTVTTYTQKELEYYTTPTEIEPNEEIQGWTIYTAAADGNNKVYIKELKRDEKPLLPVGANTDFLAYYLAICFLEKQGKDASRFQMKLSQIEERLLSELNADEHRHDTVANEFRGNTYGWGWL